jgi:hypothetical protein
LAEKGQTPKTNHGIAYLNKQKRRTNVRRSILLNWKIFVVAGIPIFIGINSANNFDTLESFQS